MSGFQHWNKSFKILALVHTFIWCARLFISYHQSAKQVQPGNAAGGAVAGAAFGASSIPAPDIDESYLSPV